MTQVATVYGATPNGHYQQGQRHLAQGLCGLVHAPQKHGKSSWADSGPRPVLVLDVEQAAFWTPSRKIYWNPARETVPAADGSWDTCIVVVHDVDTLHRTHQILASGQHPFNSVSVDSVGSVVNQVMLSMAGLRKMERDQWGMLLRHVTKLVSDYKGLLTHPTRPVGAVTFVCGTHLDYKTGKWRPWLAGQSQDLVPYAPDYEGWLWIAEDGTHHMWTGPSKQFETGNRLWGRLPWDMQLGYPGMVEGWTLDMAVRHVISTQQG